MIFQKDMHHALRRCRAALLYRRLQQDSSRRGIILGIETSCDDTGAALIDLQGRLLIQCCGFFGVIRSNTEQDPTFQVVLDLGLTRPTNNWLI